jgi:alkylation response protein AidB-like acyl-CoA dehydrogenase
MRFSFSAEQEAFRAEVRDFISQNWEPPDSVEIELPEGDALDRVRAFSRRLAEKGWLTLAWPREYGGLGADHITQLVFKEEAAYLGAPLGDGQGLGIIGPAIMVHGTDEQRARFLPRIAAAQENWCQGFSEPNAGSDLAGLQCRAQRDGDEYVLNGTKIWTSGAGHADWIHLLARTDPTAPKHRGISYFLIDMKSPGITVQPILNLAGKPGLNQTFFDNVRVPVRQRLGEENRGWYVATTTLDFERSSIGFAAAARKTLEEIACWAKSIRRGAGTLASVPANRVKLANTAVEIEAARLLSYRVAWMQNQGLIPNHEASMAKVYSTELTQRMFGMALNLAGGYGQLAPESMLAPLQGKIEYSYLWNVSPTIYGGSSEIQRNIIATRGLGLPRV